MKLSEDIVLNALRHHADQATPHEGWATVHPDYVHSSIIEDIEEHIFRSILRILETTGYYRRISDDCGMVKL
jgi:hypothetical protein